MKGGLGAKAPQLAARPTVDVSYLLWASSGIYGVRYPMAICYFSVSQCATGPTRESGECHRQPRMEENTTGTSY